jgi:thioredoxin-like negative regulator of GroEL
MKRLLWIGCACLWLGAATGWCADERTSEDQAYGEGTKAMNEGRWGDAEKAFQQVADMRANRADGAVYWEAYVQNKQGQPDRAVATCGRLDSDYPRSKWRRECVALLIDIRKRDGDQGNVVSTPEGKQDDELKMLALNGLMQQDPARALPIVKSILQSNTQSPRLKERALFVLAQSRSKDAQDILDQIAHGQQDPELQVKAIHMLAAMKGKDSAPFLRETYKSSQNDRVRNAVIDGMFISGDVEDLVSIARVETNPERKKNIVSKLSLMHSKEATDYMLELLNK